ncbi:MAG: hypothetical protein ACREO9_12095, partial [Lysobacterales bacterium]
MSLTTTRIHGKLAGQHVLPACGGKHVDTSPVIQGDQHQVIGRFGQGQGVHLLTLHFKHRLAAIGKFEAGDNLPALNP